MFLKGRKNTKVFQQHLQKVWHILIDVCEAVVFPRAVSSVVFPQFQPECYYRGFRDDSGTFTPVHWKILALKFAFVIIFEHVVFGVCRLIDVIVPDIPESLDIKVKRERYLAKEALQDAEHVLQKVKPVLSLV